MVSPLGEMAAETASRREGGALASCDTRERLRSAEGGRGRPRGAGENGGKVVCAKGRVPYYTYTSVCVPVRGTGVPVYKSSEGRGKRKEESLSFAPKEDLDFCVR